MPVLDLINTVPCQHNFINVSDFINASISVRPGQHGFISTYFHQCQIVSTRVSVLVLINTVPFNMSDLFNINTVPSQFDYITVLDLTYTNASVISYQHCVPVQHSLSTSYILSTHLPVLDPINTVLFQHDFSNVLDLINTSASVRSYQHCALPT